MLYLIIIFYFFTVECKIRNVEECSRCSFPKNVEVETPSSFI